MSEFGPHDTLHFEWIIHISLRSKHIWGTYPQWQINQITKEFISLPDVVCFNIVRNIPQNMMLLGSDM